MENKITALVFLVILILGSGLISCGDGFNCGPFDDKFKLTELSGSIFAVEFNSQANGWPSFAAFDGNLIRFDQFSIGVQQNVETYTWNNNSRNFGLIPTANACSPPIPRSEEIIDRILITANNDYNSEYPLGSDLSNVFDIIVYDEFRDLVFERFDLNEFIATEPNVPNSWYLVLKEGPITTTDFQFNIQYFQQGIDIDFFEFTTENVMIE